MQPKPLVPFCFFWAKSLQHVQICFWFPSQTSFASPNCPLLNLSLWVPFWHCACILLEPPVKLSFVSPLPHIYLLISVGTQNWATVPRAWLTCLLLCNRPTSTSSKLKFWLLILTSFVAMVLATTCSCKTSELIVLSLPEDTECVSGHLKQLLLGLT